MVPGSWGQTVTEGMGSPGGGTPVVLRGGVQVRPAPGSGMGQGAVGMGLDEGIQGDAHHWP